MLFVLLIFALSAVAALPPPVPQNSDQIHEYMRDHGKNLLEEYAIMRAGGFMSKDTLQESAHRMYIHMSARNAGDKMRYLTSIHEKLSRKNQRLIVKNVVV